MKKIGFFIIFVIAFSLLLVSCSDIHAQKLSTPSNLREEDQILMWDAVENASGYIVYLNKKEYFTTECNFDLGIITEVGEYIIEVMAVGDDINFIESDGREFKYIKQPEAPVVPTEGLLYNELLDENGNCYGYEVYFDSLKFPENLVIPDELNDGLPVLRIANYAFDYGYIAFHYCGIPTLVPDYDKEIVCNTRTEYLRLPKYLESIGSSAFNGFTNLQRVDIPEGVKSIGSSAFEGNIRLTKLKLPSTLESIGASAFKKCRMLDNIVIPEGVTRLEESVFSGCYSLSNITFPSNINYVGAHTLDYTPWYNEHPDGFIVFGEYLVGYRGKTLTDNWPKEIKYVVRNAFSFSNIETAVLPSNVSVSVAGLFENCETVREVILPDNMTEIPRAYFAGCKSLKTVHLPSSLQVIGDNAFRYTDLEILDIPEGVIEVGTYAFGGSSLREISVPASLKKGNNIFFNCYRLENVRFNDGCTTVFMSMFKNAGKDATGNPIMNVELPDSVISIESSAFSGCGLLSLKLPEHLESIGIGAFLNCTVKTLDLPSSLVTIERSAFKGSGLTSIEIPDSITELPEFLFQDCAELSDLKLHDGITKIGWSTFENCAKLGKLDLPSSLVTIERSAFKGSGLTSVEIPVGVTEIKETVFQDCAELSDLKLHDGITKIGESAFENCVKLGNVDLPSSLVSIEKNAFRGCGLTSVEIPTGITRIGISVFQGCTELSDVKFHDGVKSILAYAFEFCEKLTEIHLPAALTVIGKNAFEGTGLTRVVLPQGVKDFSGFKDCKSLREVVMGDKIETIDSYAFDGCVNLREIKLPDSLTEIGDRAFAGTSITEIVIPETVTKIGSHVFDGCTALKTMVISAALADNLSCLAGSDENSAPPLEKLFFCGGKVLWGGYFPFDSENAFYPKGTKVYFYTDDVSIPYFGYYWTYDNDGGIIEIVNV